MGIWHRSHLRQTHLDFHFWQKTVFQLNIYDQSQREVISFRTFLMSHILRQQGSRDSSRQCVISVSRCHDHTKSRSQYIYLKTEDVIGYYRLTSMKSCINLSLQQIPANKITAVFSIFYSILCFPGNVMEQRWFTSFWNSFGLWTCCKRSTVYQHLWRFWEFYDSLCLPLISTLHLVIARRLLEP